ncbi:hypothetical protein I7I50_11044 [Histoplasma capsulatum G186AR]|uniref:Uncharacterized protein n=1 Tax=Ajellomyces capsulatus TaxID=5037 RepID=A0A8H7Z4M7_AJECA|nr:hypothetical protein I7I52_02283 [Histoplasma capsulatum]QSS69673.1 hypothetical protein I7I50_11044 [Histoplasma capsulatum G186AR]
MKVPVCYVVRFTTSRILHSRTLNLHTRAPGLEDTNRKKMQSEKNEIKELRRSFPADLCCRACVFYPTLDAYEACTYGYEKEKKSTPASFYS